MDSPIATSIQYPSIVLKAAWDAYVWSTQFVPHVVLVCAILKLGLFLLSSQVGQAAFRHPPIASYRGRLQGVSRRPSLPPFHPNAQPMVLNSPSALSLILWYWSNVVAPAVDVVMSALSKWSSLVESIKHASPVSTINSVIIPLGTRLNRGIAQLSTLDAFIPDVAVYRTALQYFRPASFLLIVFAVLVAVLGLSLELAVLGVGGLLVVATADIGASEESEADNIVADSTPEMTNAGLVGVLLADEP